MATDLRGAGNMVGTIWLTESWLVLEVNETVVRWLGYEVEEMLAKPLHAFLGGGGQFFLQSQILPMLLLKERLEEVYLRMREKSGGTVPALANLGYVTRGDGIQIELSFVRITQRSQLEDELLRAKKLAEQGNDAKTKFLGMMSHELRTPLQLIGLNNQMLCEGVFGSLQAEQLDIIRSSQDATESVVALIDDILNFAGMQSGKVNVAIESLTVGQVLRRTEISIRHRMQQSGLRFQPECSQPEIKVLADPNRLQQVLVNLLNNALKFTPHGGSIQLMALERAGMVVFEVTDTGCGIPAEQLERIFEPFIQLRSTIESTDKPGVGLGLAICRDLVKAMGGRIEVRSELGKGSTFSVLLRTS